MSARYVVDRRGPGFGRSQGFTVTDSQTGKVVAPLAARWSKSRAQQEADKMNAAVTEDGGQ